MRTSRLDRWTVLYFAVVTLFVLLGGVVSSAHSAFAATDVGYRDQSFAANSVANPTGEKPQSKLWFNDGIWWASMFNKTTEEFHIYRYDQSSHAWSDTGTLIDERNSSKADTLWDGTHLYVASAGAQATNTNHGARILRYSYDPATKKYTLDQGFPITVTAGGLETIVIDKDSTGKLWITYTRNSVFNDDGSLPRQVYISHTLGDDKSWSTPYVLPVRGASNLSSDDISSVVTFDSQIGVMWSNQVDDAVYFATHKDGDPDDVWQSSRTTIQGPKYADDHISLRSVSATDSSGRVFAAVKTSLNDASAADPNAPLIVLLVRDRDGNWSNHTFSRVADNQTRPIVMLDEEHRDLYMFATSSCCNGGAILYKKTNLNNISFSDGPGEPFIQSATDVNINDATSTKQNVNSATGLMVMASSGVSGYYWHNAIELAASDTTPPAAPTINSPADNSYDTDGNITLSGTAEANSTLEIFDATTSKGTTQADALGNWSKTLSGVAEGSHAYTAKATDAAGNTSVPSSPHTVTVDTTAPTVSSTTPSEGATGVAVTEGVTVTFSESVDASTITASNFTLTRQGSTTPVGAGVSYDSATQKATLTPDSSLESGVSYSVVVRGGTGGVRDVAGNTLAQDKTVSFTTAQAPDTTPPTVSLTAPDEGSVVTGPTVTLSAAATDDRGVDSVRFMVDGNVVGSGISDPYSITWDSTSVQDGFVSITASAFDGAGNSNTSVGRTVAVNNTRPDTTVTSGPTGVGNGDAATFEFTSSERDSTFRCSLDGEPFGTCTSSKTYSGLATGEHTLRVFAVGAGGEANDSDSSPASRTWTVGTPDTTPPAAPTINSPADNSYDTDGNITLSGTAETNSTVEIFDATTSKGTTQADALGNWSKTLSGVAEGSHAYTAKATDAAGNTSVPSSTRTVIVDTTAPNATITSGPSGSATSGATVSFTFSSSEADSTFECRLDSAVMTSCSSPKGYSGLADGSHTFSVRATDAAGNVGVATRRTWSVDATAPTVSGVTPTGGATNVAVGVSVEATFSEAMNASTVGQGTFTLVRQGTTTPVTATVGYDAQARKAVLMPTAALAEGATYTATIKGGTNGVKDNVGNPLQADKTWTFSTTAVLAPSNLSATRAGSGAKQRVDLNWVDNSKVEAKFVIERSTASNFTSNLVTYDAPANATGYSDTGVQPNKQYYYRVFAVNSAGTRSTASNVASVTTSK